MNKTNLIVAGVHKSATTSLYNYFGSHPMVYRPLKKELHFFTPLVYNKPIGTVNMYASFFSNAEDSIQYLLDVSPSYLYGGNQLIQQIKKYCDKVKVIIMLRNPTNRFVSFYKQGVKRGVIQKNTSLKSFFLESQMAYSKYRQTGIHIDSFVNRSLREGCYADYIERWIEAFGENLKIVFFEDFVKDTRTAMSGIVKWLEIENIYLNYEFKNSSPSFKPRSQLISGFVYNTFLHYESFFRRNEKLKITLKKIYSKINASEYNNEEILDTTEIEKFYNDKNNILYKLLDTYSIKYYRWDDKGK